MRHKSRRNKTLYEGGVEHCDGVVGGWGGGIRSFL
jgi:hypothetical protein